MLACITPQLAASFIPETAPATGKKAGAAFFRLGALGAENRKPIS